MLTDNVAKSFVNSYDLTNVQDRLVLVDGWSAASAAEVMQQYKNFLFIYKKYGHTYTLTPSVEIDAAWHAHILHTKEYNEFCEKFFGRFLHHTPELPTSNNSNNKSNAANFQRTQELYEKEFGIPIYQIKKISFRDRLWPLGRKKRYKRITTQQSKLKKS